jgi:hypothetical protein
VSVVPEAVDPARRAYARALLLLAAGGLLLVAGYGLTWASAQVPLLAGSGGVTQAQEYSGRDLLPAAAMSGWLSLAAVAGVIATRSWGRAVVAAIALLAGVAGAAGAVAFAVAPAWLIDGAASRVLGVDTQVSSASRPGWVLAVIAGLSVITASSWTLARGRRWPTLGSRYERRAPNARTVSDWEAQDLGRDPTDDLVE